MTQSVIDVIVIGAGLSGLQAALTLQKAGLSVTILEARDRVGGKTYSIERADGKGVQEIGAAWLNDSNQSHIWAYCKRFGLTPVVQNIEGNVACEDEDGKCHFFPFGQLPNVRLKLPLHPVSQILQSNKIQFTESELDEIRTVVKTVEEASRNNDNFQQPNRTALDNVTLEHWCRQRGVGERAYQTVRLWCRGTFGQEPGELSALAFLEVAHGSLGITNLRYDGKHGGQYLRLLEGTQSITKGMATLLPRHSIRLSTQVRAVSALSEDLTIVTTMAGEILKARKVIISVPAPAYRSILFDPPLPHARQTYNMATRYGVFVKYICLFRTPFWRRQGACGLTQSFRGPVNHSRDTSVDKTDNYALTCFMSAAPGRRWLTLNEEQRREQVLRQLGSLFAVGYDAVCEEFLSDLTSSWTEDPLAGWGCPFAAPPPGVLANDDDALFKPFRGLHFVGTEFVREWRGYMDGALRSGKRGAEQVIAGLQETKLSSRL